MVWVPVQRPPAGVRVSVADNLGLTSSASPDAAVTPNAFATSNVPDIPAEAIGAAGRAAPACGAGMAAGAEVDADGEARAGALRSRYGLDVPLVSALPMKEGPLPMTVAVGVG